VLDLKAPMGLFVFDGPQGPFLFVAGVVLAKDLDA
jgi:hypothetical protein